MLRAKQRLEAKGRLLRVFPSDAMGVEIGVHEGDYAARILRAARRILDEPAFKEAAERVRDSFEAAAGANAAARHLEGLL